MDSSEGEQPVCRWGHTFVWQRLACEGMRWAKGGALHGPIGVTEPMPHVVVHCRPMAPFPSVCPTFVEGSNV